MRDPLKTGITIVIGIVLGYASLGFLTAGLLGYNDCHRSVPEGTQIESEHSSWPKRGEECTYILPSGRRIVDKPGYAALIFLLLGILIPVSFTAYLIWDRGKRRPASPA